MVTTGRKRCRFGKSCSATCISKTFFCIVELGPEIAKMLSQARDRVRAVYGKKDNRLKDSNVGSNIEVRKAEKLAKKYKSLPEGHPDRAKIASQIKELGFNVGSVKGYDDLSIRMRNPKFDLNKHYD